MKIKIKGIEIEYDEEIEFYDYLSDKGLITIDFKEKLSILDKSKGNKHKNNFKKELIRLTRWISEAPRKRSIREISKVKFITVATTENLFKGEKGGKIIDNLEKTGKFAQYLLRKLYNSNEIMIWVGHDILGKYKVVNKKT
jgi:hypothetical protein